MGRMKELYIEMLERDLESLGGREKLEDTVKNGKKNAQAILDMPPGEEKDKAIINAGGLDKLNKIVSDTKEYEVPKRTELGPDKVTSKEEFVKNSRKTKLAAAEQWEQQYGKNYNKDGTRIAIPAEKENTPPAPSKESSVPAPTPVPTPEPKATPIPAKAESSSSESSSNQPIVAVNNSTNNIGGSKPKMFNLDSIKMRNEDLAIFNYRNSQIV
jgi:hypothetical protein